MAETRLSTADLIAPLFVAESLTEPRPIESLPGQFQHTIDSLLAEVTRLVDLGVTAVTLFGVPTSKDERGSAASDPDGIIQVALRRLTAELGDAVLLIPDLCLDEYTDHGHCGLLTP